LGKTDDSIAAYRKSVATKPTFESNLNLGVMLAKTGSLTRNSFLRTATKLKPNAHVEEAQARGLAVAG